MKQAQILHNPKAGDSNYSKEELINLVESNGFEAHYKSLKEQGWDELSIEINILVVCGGDGSIRKVTKALLERKLDYPIALIPGGTANNFAKNLGLHTDMDASIRKWNTNHLKKIDIGEIKGENIQEFFLESFGIGVFPELMHRMEQLGEKEEKADDEMNTALKEFHKIVQTYDGFSCTIHANGITYSGIYLMIEIMNISSIGPGLDLAADANPYDGMLNIVLVTLEQRQQLGSHVFQKLRETDKSYLSQTILTKEIKITWKGAHAHADDKIMKMQDSSLSIRLGERKLKVYTDN